MKKLKITKENVHNHVEQFNLHHLIHQRAHLNEKGWTDIAIDQSFFDKSIDDVVDLIGGRGNTKEEIKFKLRNQPVSAWFTNRFIFSPYNIWVYVAGQDYVAEMSEIRKYLKKL